MSGTVERDTTESSVMRRRLAVAELVANHVIVLDDAALEPKRLNERPSVCSAALAEQWLPHALVNFVEGTDAGSTPIANPEDLKSRKCA